MPGDPSVGDVLVDRYELLEQIGSGGHGVVFRAKQLTLDRQVAIKIVRSDAIAERVAERFVREAQVLKKLSHPNTVQTVDFGLIDQRTPFIVFELLKGEPLDVTLAREGALPPHRVARVAEQILKSLMEAHEHGVVHRDLKPANIFVCEVHGETDYVKVLDFGIAKALSNDDPNRPPTITLDGFAVGTPNYMAPEQVLGEGVGVRTDLYSLGLVMAEMLAGRIIVEATTPQRTAMAQASNEPVELPTEVLQSPLGHLIVRAVQKKPDRRFKSAEQMLKMLKAAAVTPTAEIRRRAGAAAGAVGFAETDVVPTSPTAGLPSPAPRVRPAVTILVGVVALLALAVAFAATQSRSRAPATTDTIFKTVIVPPEEAQNSASELGPPVSENDAAARLLLDQAVELSKNDIDTAHKLLKRIPDGEVRNSNDFRKIEDQWADAMFALADTTDDVSAKRSLLNEIGDTRTVSAEKRNKALLLARELGPPPASPPPSVSSVTSGAHETPLGGDKRFDESAAKNRLYPKVAGGTASEAEIRMLRAICSRQADRPCRNMASGKLKELLQNR